MNDSLKERARALGLHGLVAHWGEIGEHDWASALIAWEEDERRSRSLKRRLADARLGQFKPLADFDWDWCCLADCLTTDSSDYLARLGPGFPGLSDHCG